MSTSHIVIDNGTGTIKAGFSTDEAPVCIFDNVIGSVKYSKCMSGALETRHVGENVQKHRGILKLSYPMEHGTIVDWEGMERVWNYMYSKLSIMSEEHNVLLTEVPLTPIKLKERQAEIFFETHNVPGIYFALQPVLVLYASGNKTGVVLDSGEGCSHAVAIYEGYCIPHAINRIDVAGRDITDFFRLQLRKVGYPFSTSAEFEIVRTIKEQACAVSHAAAKEEERAHGGTFDTAYFKLPDGHNLELGVERYRAPEILFSPALIGSECESIHEVLINCIRKCDTDIRPHLYPNVYLAGGTTLLSGFGDRLLAEVRRISPKDAKIKLHAARERIYLAWLGGSILSSLSSFKSTCINKQRFQEEGGRVL